MIDLPTPKLTDDYIDLYFADDNGNMVTLTLEAQDYGILIVVRGDVDDSEYESPEEIAERYNRCFLRRVESETEVAYNGAYDILPWLKKHWKKSLRREYD